MKTPGRPKNGVQPVWHLKRATLVLFAYERARKAGDKHSVAVTEAVNHVRKTAPSMSISDTTVKRILAEWQPSGSATALSVTEPSPEHRTLTLPNGRVVRILLTASVGPRTNYHRASGV